MIDNKRISQLITNMAKGDQKALVELWTQMKEGLYFFILTFIHDRQLAEDALQETFIAIYKSAARFKYPSNARAWIFTLAKNTSISLLRKQKDTLSSHEELEKIPDVHSFERQTERKDELSRLLDDLDETSRKIVLLHAVSDLKHNEIAKLLTLPLGTVYRRYSQSIKKLKHGYSEHLKQEV